MCITWLCGITVREGDKTPCFHHFSGVLNQPCLGLIWVLALAVSCINIPSRPRNTLIKKKFRLLVLAAFIGITFTKQQWGLGWASDFPGDSSLVPATCWLLQNQFITPGAACKSAALIPVYDQNYAAQSSDYKTQRSQTSWSSSHCWSAADKVYF